MKNAERLLNEKLRNLLALEKDRRQSLAQIDPTELTDEGDLASNNSEMEMTSKLVECWEREADQVQSALRRLSEDRYGCCADCEDSIPRARLTALPYATLCVACQRDREKLRRSSA